MIKVSSVITESHGRYMIYSMDLPGCQIPFPLDHKIHKILLSFSGWGELVVDGVGIVIGGDSCGCTHHPRE